MKINILQLEEGAEKAEGITVIIDVFRAFSLEAILLANGASEIVCCYQQEQARKLHDMHADWVLIGERDGEKLPGFDYGNSPSAVRQISFAGKTVIHTTTNGTRGLAAAVKADILLAASLLNAKATARYIAEQNPREVSLVCMGWKRRMTEEDTLCAEYIRALLLQEPFADLQEKCQALRFTEGKKFFDPHTQDVFPKEDFYICTKPDQYDFAIISARHGDLFQNKREDGHA